LAAAIVSVDGEWWMVDGEEEIFPSSPSTIHHPPSTELTNSSRKRKKPCGRAEDHFFNLKVSPHAKERNGGRCAAEGN
jgi:hypothetical protein